MNDWLFLYHCIHLKRSVLFLISMLKMYFFVNIFTTKLLTFVTYRLTMWLHHLLVLRNICMLIRLIQQLDVRMDQNAREEVFYVIRISARNNFQQLAIFRTFWLFVSTKLHLAGQIVRLVIRIIQQNNNSSLTARLI